MLAFAIRYLLGQAVAAHPKSREQYEWPPHPDRLFMALVAAYYDTNADSAERAALEWLEALPHPALYATTGIETRETVPVYVPVNGDRRTMSVAKLMPSERKRDKRFFPTVILEEDTAYLIWPKDVEPPAEHRPALERLCAKVGYLGDTSSLVQVWVEANPPVPNLAPTNNGRGDMQLRVPYAGRLRDLEESFAHDVEAGEYQPRDFDWKPYQIVEHLPLEIPASVFGELIVLRQMAGQRFNSMDTLVLTEALRGAVMTHCPQQPPPEWVSGHKTNNTPSEHDHLAFIPLVDVGHAFAEGELKGMALVIPRHISRETALEIALNLFTESGDPMMARLVLGRHGEMTVALDDIAFKPLETLRWRTWTHPAERWATVTPLVLDRFPKAEGDAEEIVARACERIGLPRPRDVIFTRASLFEGVPLAQEFPSLPGKFNKSRGLQRHALLIFDEQVRGPVLLGAGRYRGYGLCRPYRNPRGGDA